MIAGNGFGALGQAAMRMPGREHEVARAFRQKIGERRELRHGGLFPDPVDEAEQTQHDAEWKHEDVPGEGEHVPGIDENIRDKDEAVVEARIEVVFDHFLEKNYSLITEKIIQKD